MRSIEEIDADIAEVQKRIASRNEGMPSRNDPTYRASRFDYIVEGDRSGLDAYQNAVNAAIQNKLSRDSAEKMAKAGKEQADEEAMDQWQKEYSFAKSAQSDIYNNPASTQKQKEDADANVRYQEAVGRRKGWLDKYKAMTAVPVEAAASTAVETPKQEAPKETFKQLMGRGQTLEKDDDLDAYINDVKAYTGNDAVVGEAYDAIAKAQEKKKENATGRWNEYNSRVKAALGEKDYAKRKAALEPLKEELAKYKGQEKYAEVEKSINDGLKKPAKDPLTKGVVRQNFGKNDVITMMKDLMAAKEKGVTKNVSVGDKGRTVTFKLLQNGDVQVLNEKGKEIDRFKKAELDEFDTSGRIAVEPKQADIPIVKALKGESKFPNGRVIVGPGEDW